MKKSYANHNPGLILREAVLNVAKLWQINNKELAKIIGTSESSISRLYSDNNKAINPNSKEGELVILLIRAFRSLDAYLGNALDNEISWLRSYNRVFHQAPLEHMKNVTGLVAVVNYLDAIRGKI